MALPGMQARRHQEARGPGGGPVAKVYSNTRANGRHREQIIFQSRAENDRRSAAAAIVDDNRRAEQLNRWENKTDAKVKAMAVQKKFEQLLENDAMNLEARRERLRDLLAREHQQYQGELAVRVETPLDRQARMREKLKSLREEREAERQQIVEEKKEQMFIQNCEQLRALKTKQAENDLWFEREEQLKEKQNIKENAKNIDSYFDMLYEENRQQKEARAQRDADHAARLARLQTDVLKKQIKSVEELRREEELNKEEQRRIRIEQEALLAEEEQLRVEQAARDRLARNKELDRFNRRNAQLRQEGMRRELEQDMKLLAKVISEASDEREEARARKAQLKEEMELYHQYLREHEEAVKKQNELIDQFLHAESERAWDQRQAKWNKEKEARNKLMKEVTDFRQQQISAKLKEIELKQLENEEERRIAEQLALEHEYQEEQKLEFQRKQRIALEDELQQQIHYDRMQRQRAIENEERAERERQRSMMEEEKKTQSMLQNFSLSGKGFSFGDRKAPF